jgi:hypothetical protein
VAKILEVLKVAAWSTLDHPVCVLHRRVKRHRATSAVDEIESLDYTASHMITHLEKNEFFLNPGLLCDKSIFTGLYVKLANPIKVAYFAIRCLVELVIDPVQIHVRTVYPESEYNLATRKLINLETF